MQMTQAVSPEAAYVLGIASGISVPIRGVPMNFKIPHVPDLDCFALLCDMASRGVNNREVARRLGLAASTVERWKAGAQPRWADGQRLVALHTYIVENVRQSVSTNPENEPCSS